MIFWIIQSPVNTYLCIDLETFSFSLLLQYWMYLVYSLRTILIGFEPFPSVKASRIYCLIWWYSYWINDYGLMDYAPSTSYMYKIYVFLSLFSIFHLFFFPFLLKVRGQISLLYGSSLIFGLSGFPVSEFEVVAEELLISYSIIKVWWLLWVSPSTCTYQLWLNLFMVTLDVTEWLIKFMHFLYLVLSFCVVCLKFSLLEMRMG